MWILKWLVFTIVIIFILIFAFQNVGNPAFTAGLSFSFLGGKTPELPVFLWIIIGFLAGVVVVLAFSVFHEFSMRAEIMNLKHRLRNSEDNHAGEDRGDIIDEE